LRLPHTFVIPDTLFEAELRSLAEPEKLALRKSGLGIRQLDKPMIERGMRYSNRLRGLHLNDCLALVLAEETKGCLLLTGDRRLRRIAEGKGIEVHGALWALDEMLAHGVASPEKIRDALRMFLEDKTVFLPEDELLARIGRLKHLT